MDVLNNIYNGIDIIVISIILISSIVASSGGLIGD